MWDDRINNFIPTGDGETTQCLNTKHKGSISLVEKIERTNRGYLHELYWYATKTIGYLSGFAAIAICMNMKSAIPSKQNHTLALHQLQVNRWFKANNGRIGFVGKKKYLKQILIQLTYFY